MLWTVRMDMTDLLGRKHEINTAADGDSQESARFQAYRTGLEMGFQVLGIKVGFGAPDDLLPFGTRVVTPWGTLARVIADTGALDVWMTSPNHGEFAQLRKWELVTLDSIHAAALEFEACCLEQCHQTDPNDVYYLALHP